VVVETRIHDALGWITLNRPDVRNALSGELMEAIGEAIERHQADDDVRAIVITGAGSAFCAGADLRTMQSARDASDDANRADAYRMGSLFHRVAACRKPVVARVNGPAIGGGVGLMAACDIVVATEKARFQFSEVRLGIVPAVISPFCIRRLGPTVAKRLFLTGEPIDARQALAYSLIDVMAPEGDLDAAVEKTAADLGKAGPNALIAAKELVDTVARLGIENALEYTAEMIARLRISDEAAEGIAAFLQKRPAAWVPRGGGGGA